MRADDPLTTFVWRLVCVICNSDALVAIEQQPYCAGCRRRLVLRTMPATSTTKAQQTVDSRNATKALASVGLVRVGGGYRCVEPS